MPDVRSSQPISSTSGSRNLSQAIWNVIRGALIGLAELVPGVSGGTVALVTGIYERALDQGNALIDLTKAIISDRSQVRAASRRVDWFFLFAVAVGMLTAVFAVSGVMHSFVENSPLAARSLFMGMVLVCVAVPLTMVDKRELAHRRFPAILFFICFALLTFWATGFSPSEVDDPPRIAFFFAAAIAVCALVLPGVSGSFFLLTVGLYGPTMAAVSERNAPILFVFALGALTGIVCFVRVLGWLLTSHRTLTLVSMGGILLGSLRALWPWQAEDGSLRAPGENIGLALGLFALGVLIVSVLLIAECTRQRKTPTPMSSL